MERNLDPNVTEMECHDAEMDDNRHVTRNEDVDMRFCGNWAEFLDAAEEIKLRILQINIGNM